MAETMPSPVCRETVPDTFAGMYRHLRSHRTVAVYRWLWSLNPATAILTVLASVLLTALVALIAYVAATRG